MKIDKITICLHCGCSQEVVDRQMKLLSGLQDYVEVKWNNRIDRHPKIYDSYSELINHSIITSPTEWVILINDRTLPKLEEAKKMIGLLESGFSCVYLYNVGFMGFSKELIREIGWWDERFTNGGCEDFDWTWRIRQADLALYESSESTYEHHWKSPLNVPGCHISWPYFQQKYDWDSYTVRKLIPEENYDKYKDALGRRRLDIKSTWKKWDESILNVEYCGPNKGQAPSQRLGHKPGFPGIEQDSPTVPPCQIRKIENSF